VTQLIEVHPQNPQPRLIAKLVDLLKQDALLVCPTDAAYALVCLPGSKKPLEQLIRIRQLDNKHLFTLMCRDFSQATQYAHIENTHFRLLKSVLPGPYTCILPATRLTPKRLLTKRDSIGIRIPDHNICQALLAEIDMPLLISTLILPGEAEPLCEPYLIVEALENQVEAVIDGGEGACELTTVISLTDFYPQVVREGLGSIKAFVN
jgi:tRNA threonylcarbamoyl adenosine modification protein (Sua5/YciO/YrdC/YwlC family)